MQYRVVVGFFDEDGSFTPDPLTGAMVDAPTLADAQRMVDLTLHDDVARSCVGGRALKLWCLENVETSIFSADNGWSPASA